MKIIFFVFVICFFSCQNSEKEREEEHHHGPTSDYCRGCYREDSILFYSPYNYNPYNYFTSVWMRKPSNLMILHETFKSVGYLDYFKTGSSNENKSVKNISNNVSGYYNYITVHYRYILDSIYVTYPDYEKKTSFYREFWQRRVKEGTDSVVYIIVSDIKKILDTEKEMIPNEELVNDSLAYILTNIRAYGNDTLLNEKSAIKYFNFFKSIGWHQSAYHFIAKNPITQNFKWNLDSLINTLEKRKVKWRKPSGFSPFIENETDDWDICQKKSPPFRRGSKYLAKK